MTLIGFNTGFFKSKIFEKTTGINADLSSFMEPKEIAKFIKQILDLPKNMEVTNITLNRK